MGHILSSFQKVRTMSKIEKEKGFCALFQLLEYLFNVFLELIQPLKVLEIHPMVDLPVGIDAQG